MAAIKPGVYREPANGHSIEVFDDASFVPEGYEWIASSEDHAAGKFPPYVPPHLKARKAPPANKARSATSAEDK